MARSASSSRIAVSVALLGVALSGCATTQEQAARLQLNGARIRAAEAPVAVTAISPAVTVQDVRLLGDGRQAAIVVQLANRGPAALSDLPILVGLIKPGHRRVALNRSADLDYFQSHLPAIPAHGRLTWVFTQPGRPPAGARPFAEVGGTPVPTVAIPGRLPRVTATVVSRPGGPERQLSVRLTNASGIPQLQLVVYVLVRRGARFLAAGDAAVPQLGGGAATTVQVPLVGNPSGPSIAVAAPPTIFS